MLKSMTGFGSRVGEVSGLGKVSAELRSTNHKFLDMVFHLPEGLLFLEERIKKEIETKVKRGRLTCVVNIVEPRVAQVSINKALLKKYVAAFKEIKGQFKIQDALRLDTLIHLPGVLSLSETRPAKASIWPGLHALVRKALGDLLKMRQKEGRALSVYLKNRAVALDKELQRIKQRFSKVIPQKLTEFKTDEERASFLKERDISEEIERLSFHIRNFKNKLLQNEPVGKELDFIAQEMQREANTMAAKSLDAHISAQVVETKAQIEKIREQAQNIE